ncbi:winged helix-turn-helix transcriptional regulator [Candidatus Woesearchaeota archaeon]|nr:winged helix-turn-helix transcriptional regulator [Candidatus Woesearchaeota archaeon]
MNIETLDKNFSIKKFLHSRTKFTRRLFGLEHPKNAVFLLDESKGINEEFRNALKLHFDENHIKSIIFCQQDISEVPELFKERIGNRIITLDRLSEEKAFELVRKRCGKISPFTEGAVTLIVDKSNYIPRKILENCEKVCMVLKGKKEITINDVQNVLKIKQEISQKSDSLSPMEESMLKILKEANKTAQELAELLKTTEGSVGKQLSKLIHKNLVKIVSHQRPKVYGLN